MKGLLGPSFPPVFFVFLEPPFSTSASRLRRWSKINLGVFPLISHFWGVFSLFNFFFIRFISPKVINLSWYFLLFFACNAFFSWGFPYGSLFSWVFWGVSTPCPPLGFKWSPPTVPIILVFAAKMPRPGLGPPSVAYFSIVGVDFYPLLLSRVGPPTVGLFLHCCSRLPRKSPEMVPPHSAKNLWPLGFPFPNCLRLSGACLNLLTFRGVDHPPPRPGAPFSDGLVPFLIDGLVIFRGAPAPADWCLPTGAYYPCFWASFSGFAFARKWSPAFLVYYWPWASRFKGALPLPKWNLPRGLYFPCCWRLTPRKLLFGKVVPPYGPLFSGVFGV